MCTSVSGQYTHTHIPLVQLGVDDVLRLVGTGASREGEEVGHVLVRHAADQLVGCSEGLPSASGTNTQHLCVAVCVCGGGGETAQGSALTDEPVHSGHL